MNNIYGGKPIGSGGYGCVFYPALRCTNKSTPHRKMISKLMERKYAEEEYSEIQQIKNKLKFIPFYENYFLLNNVSLCNPKPLQPKDFINFDEKCKSSEISKKSVNTNLHKYLILNLPYGGDDLKVFLANISNNKQFIQLNNLLVDFLFQAILPMNERNVYHSDIKDTNFLVQLKGKSKFIEHIRLIDWGQSLIYHRKNEIPKAWQNRTFQFNSPLSNVLFVTDFMNKYNDLYKQSNFHLSTESLHSVIRQLIDALLKVHPGHFKTYDYFLELLLKPVGEYKGEETTYHFVINYLSSVLTTFSRPHVGFDAISYINTVYVHIVDVYGLLSCYLTLVELLSERIETLNETEQKLNSYLRTFILKYMYLPRVEKYNLNELSEDMEYFNVFFKSHGSSHKEQKSRTILKTNASIRSKVLSRREKTLSNLKRKTLKKRFL